MMDGNIRMKGMLYHHQQRFGKKWKKVWAEAVAESTHSISCMELFEFGKSSMKESKKRVEGKKVIVMRDCVKITETKMEGCPKQCSTFSLETTDKIYSFASPTEELHSWITELCKLAFPMNQAEFRSQKQDRPHEPVHMQENTLYGTTEKVREFPVITVATEAALRCKLYGEYILTLRCDSLLLKHCKTKQVLLTWPYRFIRKFGQDMLSFNFEAGRRCESGEGYFEFATGQSEQLFTIVSEALKNFSKVETSGTRPKGQHTLHNSQQSYTPPAEIKHPKKQLTSSSSLNAINLSDFSRKSNIKSAPSLPSTDQDPVYALVNRPTIHSKSSKGSKNQRLDPDIETFAENIFGVLGEEQEVDQMNRPKLDIQTKCEDFETDPVYSEVNTYADYNSKDLAVLDDDETYSLTFDLKDLQFVGLNKDASHFQSLSKDCIVYDEEQLNLSVEKLSIHHKPNVGQAEGVYSQIPNSYCDNEESVDFVEEFLYPPCPTDTHSSNFEDCQAEGFSTYDNFPQML